MSAISENRAALELVANGHKPSRDGSTPHAGYEVAYDEKNRLVLPEAPAPTDFAAHCAWLTAVFNLDPKHPITRGDREGLRGPDGHVVLERHGAPALRFEPATRSTRRPG